MKLISRFSQFYECAQNGIGSETGTAGQDMKRHVKLLGLSMRLLKYAKIRFACNILVSGDALESEVPGIATSTAQRLGYGLDDRGIEPRFIFYKGARPTSGPIQPLTQWTPGVLTPRLKQLRCEVHHSPPSSPEIKNGWRYVASSQVFHIAFLYI
jgi:hypothetical protein